MRNLSETPSRIGEDRIREAFQYATSGMAITDLDGRFHETNPAFREVLGSTEDELRSVTLLSVTHPDDRPNLHNQIHRLVAGEIRSFVLEKRCLHTRGEPVWVRSSLSLLTDQDNRPTYIILICNDLTERKRAERLLIASEKLAIIGQLASSIVHEINNPLEAVINLLYLVREADSLEEARHFATQAEDEIQRVAQIATHTLRFHKEQSKPTSTDLGDLIESVLVLFKGKLAQSQIRLQIEKGMAINLVCYPGEIRQVLANLVKNAIDAMPCGGNLHVRARSATDWRSGAGGVRITISDTGAGMAPETRKHIYDPFFTTKGSQGTGLGLWVSAEILNKYSGSMHVRSCDRPGASWTAFTLILPNRATVADVAALPAR